MRKTDRSNSTEYEVRQFRKQAKQFRKLRQRGDRNEYVVSNQEERHNNNNHLGEDHYA